MRYLSLRRAFVVLLVALLGLAPLPLASRSVDAALLPATAGRNARCNSAILSTDTRVVVSKCAYDVGNVTGWTPGTYTVTGGGNWPWTPHSGYFYPADAGRTRTLYVGPTSSPYGAVGVGQFIGYALHSYGVTSGGAGSFSMVAQPTSSATQVTCRTAPIANSYSLEDQECHYMGTMNSTALSTTLLFPNDWFAGGTPIIADPCDAFTAAWTPSGDVQQTTGNQSVTLTRSADDAAAYPLSGFFWGYNWNYGYDGTLTTFWQQLRPTRVASPFRLAGDEQTVNFSVPFSNSWSDGWNTYFNISCFHVSSGYAKARTFRRGTTGGLTDLAVQRPCSFVGVTFPSNAADTSSLFRVGVTFVPATGEPMASGGVVSLTPSRQVDGVWTNETFDTYLNPLTGGSISDPFPITAARSAFVASSTLTGGALEDETGRWSVVCEDLGGRLRIMAPLTGSPTAAPTAVGPAGDAYYDSGTSGGRSPVTVPGGGDSGAVSGDGAAGGGGDGDGAGVANDGNGNGINDDLDGIGYGDGDCEYGFGLNPSSWGPALVGATRCMLVGLFVPEPGFLSEKVSGSVEAFKEQTPFSLMFMLVEFANDLGDAIENASGSGCFDTDGSLSFGSYGNVAIEDVCIGDGMSVSSGQRQLLAALMIAPLLWALATHAVRVVRDS